MYTSKAEERTVHVKGRVLEGFWINLHNITLLSKETYLLHLKGKIYPEQLALSNNKQKKPKVF